MSNVNKLLASARRFGYPFFSMRAYSSKSVSLVYSDYGDPIRVVNRREDQIDAVEPNDVVVKLIAAPVNPADINTIQGKYPEKPPLPAVGGNEGVGEVIEVGSSVKDFSPGDRVIPGKTGLGTWRTYGKFSQIDLIKVPKEIPIAEAATFTVNPCTAYRMLKDFRNLNPGDTVIQNGANSACGQNVIQLCKAWGVNTVDVVRNRPEIDQLKHYLTQLGSSAVFTEEEIRTTDVFKSGKLKRPKLALNCVGGKSALEIMRQLENGGAIVTYGGMSREPVMIPTASLIFKDIAAYGYWMTRWTKENVDSDDRIKMFADLIELILAKKLHAPSHEFVKFDNYKDALMNTLSIQGFAGKKFILDMS